MKDLLVYLDGSFEDETRINQAEALAGQHSAHLTGILCNALPELTVTSAPVYASEDMILRLQKEAVAQGDRDHVALKERFQKLVVPNELRRLDIISGQIGETLASECRTADAIIGTRLYGHDLANPEILETVLFESGSACLLAPPKMAPASYDTVLIAWNNSSQAARAVLSALPILQKAKNVIIVMVHKHEPPEYQQEAPGADIAIHLSRHGISAEIEHLSGWHNPAEALLEEAKNRSADLIVMGGYGHSRFREWVLGGVTRDVLTSATIPILLAH